MCVWARICACAFTLVCGRVCAGGCVRAGVCGRVCAGALCMWMRVCVHQVVDHERGKVPLPSVLNGRSTPTAPHRPALYVHGVGRRVELPHCACLAGEWSCLIVHGVGRRVELPHCAWGWQASGAAGPPRRPVALQGKIITHTTQCNTTQRNTTQTRTHTRTHARTHGTLPGDV